MRLPRPCQCWGLAGLLVLWVVVPAGPAAAADRAALREQFRAALTAASKPPEGAWKKLASELEREHYPLYPYVELAALRARMARLDRSDVEQFLARWSDTLPASDLRNDYLRELARRTDWAAFRALWKPSDAHDLICDELRARLATGARLTYADVEPLWQGARALPSDCDPVLQAARAQGALDDSHVWQRLERGALAGSVEATSEAAALLDGSDRADADRIVAVLRNPPAEFANARQWTDAARTRDAISYGIARYARRNSAAAETAWADLEARFKWDEVQKDRILNALALYRSTSYSPDAMARLKALPEDARDEATREWQVRVALAAADWKQSLAALDELTAAQKADAHWRYLRARVLTKLGRAADAAPVFADVAREANFHGFLAADWIDRPYTICPLELAGSRKTEESLTRNPDLERAFEFRELGMLAEARREWNFAIGKFDERQRRLAADLAFRRGWYDRAVFAFSADPQTLRLYEQRFPVAMEKVVRHEARASGLDPAWAYAIIRAESAWMTDARSAADAYGLMQLLPGVAKQVAKADKLPYGSARDLFNPNLNVQLGTRFLARMADAYDGSPWLASAAYNAGQAPVGRWIDARGALDPDFFIETIPYKETREYVARVLAFSVIYDWRMNRTVLALSSRMPKIGQTYRAPTDHTPRKAVICAEKGGTAVGAEDASMAPPTAPSSMVPAAASDAGPR